MGIKTTVRRARAGDIGFVHRDPAVARAVMRRMIREKDVFVAVAGKQRVGFARVEFLWGKTPLLTSLWVEPESRRHGVATALLGAVERDLARRGYAELFSSTMPDNPAGKAWHRSLRFERCGFIARINPGGVGEIFYKRRLARPTNDSRSAAASASGRRAG
jgi:ribosomal protein S18 acetylase RimI-like enzyme